MNPFFQQDSMYVKIDQKHYMGEHVGLTALTRAAKITGITQALWMVIVVIACSLIIAVIPRAVYKVYKV